MPLTQEDLEQIGQIVSKAITANNQVLFAAMRAIEEHTDQSIRQLDQSIQQLRGEFNIRFENIERRLDRLETRFTAFEFQLAGIGRSLTAGEKLDGEIAATQAAQQRAIDDLARRVAKIEQRLQQ